MSKIIEETVNTVINEDTVETVVEAVKAVPVKSINWAKLGKAGAVVGIVVAAGAGIAAGVRYIQCKKQEKTDENATDPGIDNVKVAEADFVEKDSKDK